MAISGKNMNTQTDTKQLAQLFNNLTFDDQRMLSRLLNSWEKKDQRQHPRMPCSIITEYTVNEQPYQGTIKNISPGGAYISSLTLFPVNQEIFQSFFFPNFEIPIRSNSKIAWIGSDGFGVQFDRSESDM